MLKNVNAMEAETKQNMTPKIQDQYDAHAWKVTPSLSEMLVIFC